MSHYSGRRCRPCSCCISCCNLFFCCLTLQSSKNNIAPHGSRCAGTSFSLGVFRGFSAVCPISHFNAPVRRFNVLGYPYTAAVPLALCPLFVALWRGVVPCSVAFRLRGALPACPHRAPSLCPCGLVGGCPLLRWGGLGGLRRLLLRAWRSAKVAGKVSGKVAKVAGIVDVKVAVKVASACAKVAHFTPKS